MDESRAQAAKTTLRRRHDAIGFWRNVGIQIHRDERWIASKDMSFRIRSAAPRLAGKSKSVEQK